MNITQEEYSSTYQRYVQEQEDEVRQMAKENSINNPYLANEVISIQRFFTFHPYGTYCFPIIILPENTTY